MGSIQHFVFASGPCTTNCYLVGCPKTRSAVVIDPAPGSYEWILSQVKAKGWNLEAIWLTHSHWDHFADAHLLQKQLQLPLAVHILDAENVQKPGSDGLPFLIPINAAKVDCLLEEGDTLELGEFNFQVIHTPGHSPGGVCFYEKEQNILFAGDTLFRGTIGNISFPTSSPESMWASLKRLSKLPEETRVYSGHGPSTTIGKESWLNQAEERFS